MWVPDYGRPDQPLALRAHQTAEPGDDPEPNDGLDLPDFKSLHGALWRKAPRQGLGGDFTGACRARRRKMTRRQR